MHRPFALRTIAFFLVALVLSTAVSAQDYYPAISPTGIFINHDGEEEELTIGASYDGPITVSFYANPTDTTGYVIYYEWKIAKISDGEEEVLAVRSDENTEFTFKEGGMDVSYRISLAITYRHRETGIEGAVEQDNNEMMKFSLRSSSLTVYNAFSPNGDGINDIYRVKAQSLLYFRMAIFNRWGQKIVSGDEKSLDVEYEGDFTYYICWDGTISGHTADDGVYFIVIDAKGSDGIEYKERRDINVLTRIREKEELK